VLALGCGRLHEQDEGRYRLEVQEVIFDDCGLASTLGGPFDADLTIAGDWVRVRLSAFDMPMVGRYIDVVERFNLDGSVANPPAPVGGTTCLLDLVTASLEASTTAPTSFEGALRFEYQSERDDACQCELWTRYVAHRPP
jgi:hypothetical protein